MEIKNFKWMNVSDDERSLNCPICGKPWITTNKNNDVKRDACTHLRFEWTEGGIEFFGDWKTKEFEKAYIDASMKYYESKDPEEYSVDCFDSDVIDEYDFPGIDEIYEVTESGVACGPVSFTVFYGIKR